MPSVVYLGCPASERPEAEKILASADLSVVWADTVSSALTELERQHAPVLLDLARGAAALQMARELRDQHASALMFAVVDSRRPDLTAEAVLAGIADVFARPLGGRRVANAIQRELAYQSRKLPRAVEPSFDDLYADSPMMREVVGLVARAATMRAGVILRGEDGTGRQMVARAIHATQAGGAERRFVTIDCAAHDADRLEGELFGVEARSPTDDDAGGGFERVGKKSQLSEARGGTIYFQNLAEAPTRVQARLARVLRDREAVLAGTGATIDLDVRPMAGVEVTIDSAVQEGRIREDLYRRLSVIRIDLPSLRNRREDLPALANHFLRASCASQAVPPKTLARPALSLIGALPWRGNAVELRALLETVVSRVPGHTVGLDDVLAHVRLDGGAAVFAEGGTLRQARTRFERDYIAAVLEQHQGRISEAAKTLGIQRTNLYRKMRSLRVNRPPRH